MPFKCWKVCALLAFLQDLPDLEQAAWNVEASLPFASLERKKHLATAVEVAEPLRVERILEARPHIFIKLFEPFQAFLVPCELVAFDHCDRGLYVNPPEFLIPFEFLLRGALAVEEVEDSAIFLVPSFFNDGEGDLNALVDKSLVVPADAEVHHERLKVVAGIDFPALETVEP